MSIFEDVRYFLGERETPHGKRLLSLGQIVSLSVGSIGSVFGVVYLFVMNDLKWGMVLNDPATQFDLPTFAGLFTYAGVMTLVVAAAVCLFARGLADNSEAEVLGLAGVLSVLLAFDDLFLLHERVLRDAFGISEMAVFAVYAAIGMMILWRIGPQVISQRFAGLWLAIACLAAMTVADKAEKILGTQSWLFLAEETTKFCGFVLWTAFWVAYSRAVLRQA